MFGSSNPFGQPSSNPFGAQPTFGQTNTANTNPFSPRPFGSTSPFGAQTGSSMFGGTATGVFGAAQTPSPLSSSTSAFGTSTPAFGTSSTPAFGAPSTPAFGSATSTPFGGTSAFGQKPAFGGFGSPSPPQSSPFGSTFGQTQPAFGSQLFGATSQPTFGSTSTPAFGSTSTPAFGTTTPAFGSTTAPAFGASSTPAFGASSTPAFGASSTPAFGASSNPSFGFGSNTTFGQSAPAFGAASTPAFGSSTTFGSTPSPFGQSSAFGTQSTTPTFGSPGFGQTSFGGQRGGSRVAPYTSTNETDTVTGQAPGKLVSISAMQQYKDKSHEELRWEDYQLGDKGGPNPASQQPAGGSIFSQPGQSNPFGQTTPAFGQTTPAFGQTAAFGQSSAANPFSASSSSSPFGNKPPGFGGSTFASSSGSAFNSPFGATSSSTPFGTASSAPSLFGSSTTSAFGGPSSSTPFGASSTPAFGSSPFGQPSQPASLFSSTPSLGSAPAFGSSTPFGSTQSSGLFQSSTPAFGQSTPAFGQSTPAFGQSTPAFGQSTPAFGQSTPAFGQSTPAFGQSTPAFGSNLFSSSTSSMMSQSKPTGLVQSTPSLFNGFQTSNPAQTQGAFSFGNFGQLQPAASGGFGGVSTPAFGQSTFGQPTQQNIMVSTPQPVTNPFGTLPAMPQMSIGRSGGSPSVQYGISSLPVNEKPVQVRTTSLLTPRHVTQRSRIRMHSRRYNPKKDSPKVSFFSDSEEAPSTPKADAMFIPRENPRALFIQQPDQSPASAACKPTANMKEMAIPINDNGTTADDKSGASSFEKAYLQEPEDNVDDWSCGGEDTTLQNNPLSSKPVDANVKFTSRQNGVHEEHNHRGNGYISISGHRAGEAAIVYEHGADIEALMPKLRHSDYYTEPKIQELAAKERAEPGYCRRVKDFVVGRRGYGSVKFFGETDVRRLDLESVIQFNKCEVLVYMDESKKPPAGQGLNKPAEITLLNVKCVDKKTGQHYIEGAEVEKFEKRLKRKTEEQGAEFVSYSATKGEWKFRVKHFSKYCLNESGLGETLYLRIHNLLISEGLDEI